MVRQDCRAVYRRQIQALIDIFDVCVGSNPAPAINKVK